jgi:lipid II:glycine glycyltransferase (peptidoglycan interpeptide bridge formation enzyme)
MRPVTVRICTAVDPSWDRFVSSSQGTDVTQLSTWARVRAQVGFTQLYLFVNDGEQLVGGAQILVRRLPVIGRIGYLAYGPLVAADAPDEVAVRAALVDTLEHVGRQMMSGLFVQPPEAAFPISAELLARGFRRSEAGIAPVGSIRIDLTESLDVIRSRFGRRLRSWTNRWADRGVVVRRGDERDLPLLFRLMEHSAAAQGYRPTAPSYVEALYRELAPEHAALFVGELDGVPLAADLVTRCGGLVRGRFTGFDRSGPAARVSLPAAVRWEILKWAKEEGSRWLDFGGLSQQTLDIVLAGGEQPEGGWPAVDQPKLTFGGTAFRYPPPVELISSPLLRAFLRLAQRSTRGRRVLDLAAQLLRNGRSALPGPPSGRRGRQ